MRLSLPVLWILSVAAAFGVARWTAPVGPSASNRSPEMFRAGLHARDPLVRAQLLSQWLEPLGPGELPATLAIVEENPFVLEPEDLRLLMHAWSRFDAAGALAWARAWPTEGRRKKLMGAAIEAWGFRDGTGALAALEALGDEELGNQLRGKLLEGWFRSDDRLGASLYVASVPDPRQRRRLSFALASEISKEGSDAVIAWAEAIPEDAPNDFKQGSFFHASSMLAQDDPRRAAAWYEANRARPYTEGSLDAIARKWARHHDAPALFTWLRSLPPGEGERADEVGEAIHAGFRAWRQKDAEAARAWLEASLPDPKLDPAIEEYCWAVAQTAPEEAATWALSMSDEKLGQRTLTRLLRGWLRRDPPAAGAWLAQSDLPESVKQSLVAGASEPTRVRGRAGAARPAAPARGDGRPSAGPSERD